MFSGMEGLCMRSMENVSGQRPSSGMSLDVVFSNRSASKFFNMGTYLILKAWKELEIVISLANLL